MSYRFIDNLRAVSKPVWHIPLLCVQRKTPNDGQRNCPKHVEFYSKNKFEKLVHIVDFIIRIYHDARSPERNFLSANGSSTFQKWSVHHAVKNFATPTSVPESSIFCKPLLSRFRGFVTWHRKVCLLLKDCYLVSDNKDVLLTLRSQLSVTSK